MNMLMGSYYVSLFIERLLEKGNKKQYQESFANVKESRKQNKVA